MQQTKTFTLGQLSELLNAECQGDGNCEIHGIAPIQTAKAGQICFLDNARYQKHLETTEASAVILSPKHAKDCSVNSLVVDNPYLGYAYVAELFEDKPNMSAGVHSSVVIGDNCDIDPSVKMAPNVVIGNNVKIAANVQIGAGVVIDDFCEIGEDTVFYPRVTVYYGVKIGARNIIHSGVVIGSDGFGMANDKGRWHKVPQIGAVSIGNDVEIGANTTVDRGALGDTVLEDGVKIDNQVQIGHNVEIGAHTAVAGCTGISGSTKIGAHCMIGGGAGIAGHISIAPQTIVAAMSGVSKTLTEPGVYAGAPAIPIKQWRKTMVRVAQLDAMFNKVKEYEAMFNEQLSDDAS